MIWFAIVIGVGLAAFGATAGASLVAVSRAELARAVSRRLRGTRPSFAWLAQAEGELAAASATTSLGFLIFGAALPALVSRGAEWSLVALAVLAVPLALASGYVLPRWLTLPRAETVAARVGPVLRVWAALLRLVLPARGATRMHDLRALRRESAAQGLAPDDEFLLAGGVMTFSQRPVREVMTPRTEVIAIAESAPFADIIALFATSGYSRLPVYRGTLDEVIGMLHAFDLFKLRAGDPLPIRPVAIAPGSRTCGDLLLDMQRERRHLAVVLDEFGGMLGIATLEDLLEELVGEIFDEYDEPAADAVADAPAPAAIVVDGTEPAADVAERLGARLPGGEAHTIGGLVAELAGRIPAAGERFTLGGLELDVLQASPTRVERLMVRAGPAAPVPLDLRRRG